MIAPVLETRVIHHAILVRAIKGITLDNLILLLCHARDMFLRYVFSSRVISRIKEGVVAVLS